MASSPRIPAWNLDGDGDGGGRSPELFRPDALAAELARVEIRRELPFYALPQLWVFAPWPSRRRPRSETDDA